MDILAIFLYTKFGSEKNQPRHFANIPGAGWSVIFVIDCQQRKTEEI